MPRYIFFIFGKIADFSDWRVGNNVPYRDRETVYDGEFKSIVEVRKKALQLLKARLKNNKYSEIWGIGAWRVGRRSPGEDIRIKYDKDTGKFWTGKDGALVKADGTLSKKSIFDVWDEESKKSRK